ncbi:helix-turn-helix transcriptional regulator [Streptomyces caniscabiei]|uniref:helix-turn-helix domain-containing protein n=1 Tax=Streptomyces caniscabiei TaxID=2746961 RepID=UPI0029A6F519|nr:helix-turn-helix transcriptional regulator [Streptomyces caniscabiei]MDX2602008.1 helix-turn-helix transcriptional regulator [Streptomyces caniscabiei]MDX2737443.1 helix-turn-helix transcriptional regulator [Streptomyces caniscabiei]MDX2779312.1 helix-turn-helix transcriptional regulator [Streptomyces caniscabiei]
MDTKGIGRRIAYWRERRRMTQSDFGALMGQSRRWVQALEGGQRQSDPRLSVLEGAARVLSVRLEDLLSDDPVGATGECLDTAELSAIRSTLQRHDVITGTCDEAAVEPVAVEVLRRNVEYGWTAFQASHFASLGRVVPGLLVDANRAAARHEGDARLASFRLLSMSLQLVEAVAIKFGDTGLAFTAADRSVAAAERSQDPVTMAAAARHLADAMTHHGQPRAAMEFAVAAAGRLEEDLTGRGTDGLSVLGMLYLKAAMASATLDDHDSVPQLLDQSDHHARQLGEDGNAMWTAYGPTNVAVHRVAAHVRLCEGVEAIAAAEGIPAGRRDALPRERRAHHLVDLARGYTQVGHRERAVDTLLEAEAISAEEVRCRPRSHQLVEDLDRLGAGRADSRLQALADRCGLQR